MDDKFIRALSIDWSRVPEDSYLRGIPAIAHLDALPLRRPVTFLAGENGTGKSTLLEAIAVAYGFNPEGGTLNYRFSTFDDVSGLGDALKLVRSFRRARTGYFFRAESFFNLASKAAEYDAERGRPSYGDVGLHEQSHGESFLNFMQTFDGPGLYLMDEPEAALSPQRQLTLLLHMARMAAGDAQFIVATHSPILLGLPGAEILSFDGEGIHPIGWEDTDSYQVTKLFLERREGLLEKLFTEDNGI